MARVKIEDVIDHLSSEMSRALTDAVSSAAPGVSVDAHTFFRAFKRAVGRRCSTWEQVPDRYVECD